MSIASRRQLLTVDVYHRRLSSLVTERVVYLEQQKAAQTRRNLLHPTGEDLSMHTVLRYLC
jgi:hypothetical protein